MSAAVVPFNIDGRGGRRTTGQMVGEARVWERAAETLAPDVARDGVDWPGYRHAVRQAFNAYDSALSVYEAAPRGLTGGDCLRAMMTVMRMAGRFYDAFVMTDHARKRTSEARAAVIGPRLRHVGARTTTAANDNAKGGAA